MRLRFSIGLPVILLLISSGAMADPLVTDERTPSQNLKAKPKPGHAETARRILSAQHPAKGQIADDQGAAPRPGPMQLAAGDRIAYVRPVGNRQVGRAAWYGGRYIGRATTSGAELDTTHATAAHRSLPLNSLARVTNLSNGRSIIVRVTDRGPISQSFLIDVSPRAAEELDMRAAGVVPVTVEQVVEVPPDAK
jgi:rare lipoprotein A